MKLRRSTLRACIFALVATSPILLGQRGGCGGGGGGTDDASIPDMSGTWQLTFNDDLSVEVDIGGEVYNPTLAAGADTVTVTHDGQPVEYSVDCGLELISCPSELLPMTIQITQERANPRNVSLEITESECRGTITEGVCDGTVIDRTTTRNGVIAADGTSFSIVLGGGAAVEGSCALLTISVANGALVTSGSAETMDLTADEITSGELVTAYGGGCLWIGMADLDPALESAFVAASIQLRSTYTATRVR